MTPWLHSASKEPIPSFRVILCGAICPSTYGLTQGISKMNSPSNWAIDKLIPSDLDVAHELIEQTVLAMSDLDWPGGDIFHVQMAMEEALVNAIEHGNKR